MILAKNSFDKNGNLRRSEIKRRKGIYTVILPYGTSNKEAYFAAVRDMTNSEDTQALYLTAKASVKRLLDLGDDRVYCFFS